jgi:NhaA family Na+:H+ antiporter
VHTRFHPNIAPEAWAPARRAAERVFKPLERYLHVEAASGVVLLAAALVALLWANSPWAASYEALWHAPVTVGVGGWSVSRSLHFVVNEGLMTVFFFVVGLEIKRELHAGELAELRRAALPVAAALGGMVLPAVLYLAVNRSPEARVGWGVPMATDIAFAVGVLALLGKRVPPALRVLLLALAIIDDIGAILVIAIFYSSGIVWGGVLIAVGAVGAVLLMQLVGVRRSAAYFVPGVVMWLGLARAGVHPTIAGVVLGLLTPVRSWFGEQGFLVAARAALDEFRGQSQKEGHADADLLRPLGDLQQARREALPPAVRIQAGLHPWVAYGVMPVFALANAGVPLGGVALDEPVTQAVIAGIFLGLVIGKPLGVLAASWLSVRLGICTLPSGVGWRGVAVVGCVAGIGFTMSIFIAGLAFTDAATLAAAKLGVLLASGAAAVLGIAAGRALLAPPAECAGTLEEAEQSTES